MLTVTPAAGAHLVKIMDEESFPVGVAIRIAFDGQGLTMEPDSQRSGDITLEHDGRVILLLDDQINELLAEETLDLDGETLMMRDDEHDDNDGAAAENG